MDQILSGLRLSAAWLRPYNNSKPRDPRHIRVIRVRFCLLPKGLAEG
jgi:hypothetical protein